MPLGQVVDLQDLPALGLKPERNGALACAGVPVKEINIGGPSHIE
jgi:hypothetical protein